MRNLPADWDGFGTGPICQKSHDVGVDFFQFLGSFKGILSISIVVGVETEGTLLSDIHLDDRVIKIEIDCEGVTHYDDIVGGVNIGSGSFYFTQDAVRELLNG
jgi:hypothetical protein